MPNAIRPTRREEIDSGEFIFLRTGVQFGHDGIQNLKHFVPFGQNDWQFFTDGGHHRIHSFDSVMSKVNERQQANQGGTRSSFIRKRMILPKDFGGWILDGIAVMTRRSSSMPTSYKLSIYTGGIVDPGVSNVDIQSGGNFYTLFFLTLLNQYFPGDLVTVEVECVTNAISQFNEISDLEMPYITARGNV